MNCEQARHQELVEKYVTGELAEPELSAFEEHYFACDDCLAAVQVGQAIHTSSAAQPNVIEMPARRGSSGASRPRWMYAAVAAAAAIVITVVGWRALSSQSAKPQVAQNPAVAPAAANPVPTPSAASQPPATAAAEGQLLASNLGLGSIEPLAYRPSVLRGGVHEGASQRFAAAMDSYLKQDYRQAAAALAAIPVSLPNAAKPDDHITDAGVQLYLGISQMMLGQNAEAIEALRRSAAYGDTPYVENAGFYLAKALIRQNQPAAAAAELKRVVKLNGDRLDEAKHLLAQLNPGSASK